MSKRLPPWEVLNWVAHTCYMGVVESHKRKSWTQDLTRHGEGASIGIVHVELALTSNDDIPPNTFTYSPRAPRLSKWLRTPAQPLLTTRPCTSTNHLPHSSYVTATYGYSWSGPQWTTN